MIYLFDFVEKTKNIDEFGLGIFVTCIISFFIAQIIKGINLCLRKKEFVLSYFFTTGGIPSGHTALVTCLFTCLFLLSNLQFNVYVAIAAVLFFIVAQDAVGIRRQAGIQAKRINQINDEISNYNPEFSSDIKLKELLGHKPYEVLAGFFLGVMIGIISCLLLRNII